MLQGRTKDGRPGAGDDGTEHDQTVQQGAHAPANRQLVPGQQPGCRQEQQVGAEKQQVIPIRRGRAVAQHDGKVDVEHSAGKDAQ